MLRSRRALLVALSLVFGATAAQAKPRQPRVESEVAYQAKMFGTARYASFSVAGGLDWGSGVEVSAGVRLLLGQLEMRPGFSVFARTNLYAVRGRWRPSLGLELEAASNTKPSVSGEAISGSLTRVYAAQDQALLRAGVVLAPLRMQTERLLVALGSLRLSTPLNHEAGQRVYVSVSLLQVGWLL